MHRFQTIAATVVVGLVLIACGPAASQSSSPTAVPSQAAQASGGVVGPSFGEGVVAELEALIPDKIGDLTIQKSSAQGNDYLVSSGSSPQLVKFLQDLGVSPADVSLAIGSGSNAAASSSVFMFVVRAKGADSARLLSAYKTASTTAGETPIEWASSTISGKQVETGASNGATQYLYAKGEVLIWMTATDPALAEQALSGLP
ncbi:MAG: hypothetical protein M3R32_06085 [Chloroflexota bacterium]|nr:hypothetical protein [Chloroflexota bacterium]